MPTLNWIGKDAVVNHHLTVPFRLLKDGRILAVEYTGGHLFDWIAPEKKRAVGAVWESRSEVRCLFVMPTRADFSSLAAKIG